MGNVLYTEYKAVKDKIDAFRALVNLPYAYLYAPSGSGVVATAATINELLGAAASSGAYVNTGCASFYSSVLNGENSSRNGTYYTTYLNGEKNTLNNANYKVDYSSAHIDFYEHYFASVEITKNGTVYTTLYTGLNGPYYVTYHLSYDNSKHSTQYTSYNNTRNNYNLSDDDTHYVTKNYPVYSVRYTGIDTTQYGTYNSANYGTYNTSRYASYHYSN